MIRVVTKTEAAFWQTLEEFTAPRSVFDGQGDDHCDIDLRLVEKIDAYLVPKLGPWEQSDLWFHNIDYYGDGVRSLDLSVESFSPLYIEEFQRMLVGEHSDFAILLKVSTDIRGEDCRIGTVAIRSNRILVSYPLVAFLGGQI